MHEPTNISGQVSQNQRAVMQDEPVMIAWNAWKQTDDYANVLSWAGKRCEGDLWAAFSRGFAASQEHPLMDTQLVERVGAAIQLWWMTQKHEPMEQSVGQDLARAAIAALPPQGRDKDEPDAFEAWWKTYRHKNRELADYSRKKQIAFDAWYARAKLPAPPCKGGE